MIKASVCSDQCLNHNLIYVGIPVTGNPNPSLIHNFSTAKLDIKEILDNTLL